jgi:hypothetical protein
MKLSFLFLALLASASAHAGTACDKIVTCGSFEGPGARRTLDGKELDTFHERAVISSNSESEVKIELTVLGKRPDPAVYELVLTLAEDGSFVMNQNGHLYAAGVCKNEVCTYGMVPFRWGKNPVSIANAGFLRFTSEGVERSMLVSAPDGVSTQMSTLKKQ